MTDAPTTPRVDPLARAFQLPDYISADEELLALYDHMVAQLRLEASGLPMNTLQMLLIERIASFYIHVKWKESEAGRFTTPNQQKEYNVYLLNLMQEFQRVLAAGDDKLRSALLIEVQKIVLDAVNLVTDDEQRIAVRRELAGGFAALQL